MTKQLWLKYFKIAFILFLIVTISIILGRELAHIDFKRVFLLFNEISRMETFSLFYSAGVR